MRYKKKEEIKNTMFCFAVCYSHAAAVCAYLFEEVEFRQVLCVGSLASAERRQVVRCAQPQEAQRDPHQHRLLHAQRQVRVFSVHVRRILRDTHC